MLKREFILSCSGLWVTLNAKHAYSFTAEPLPWRQLPLSNYQSVRVLPSLSASSSFVDHDFSSPYFWDNFYEQQLSMQDQDEQIATENGNSTDFVFEWHDSISLQDLAALVQPNSNCLMVGCGNSLLPQTVLERNQNIHISLLDTSKTCLEQLKARYGTNEVSYVCGSATEMASYFVENPSSFYFAQNPEATYFESIIDKGLTDAFMCGDAWETPVEALLRESSRVFDPQQGGRYILVSYKIGTAIQELFREMCDRIGGDMDWEWDFDTQTLSNQRVSVSIATVRPRDCAQ